MIPSTTPEARVLALDPITRGFGFAVLEGPVTLVDWGIRYAPNDDARAPLQRIGDLIDLYNPDVIVTEDPGHQKSRRCARVGGLIEKVQRLATDDLEVHLISASLVRKVFGDDEVVTKHGIATIVAEHFPELAPRLPPRRRVWMAEDRRGAIFDAAAFGLTYFLRDETQRIARKTAPGKAS